MLIAYIPLLVAIVGLLLWALASNAIIKECGKIMFAVGLFWLVSVFAGKTVRVL